MSKIQFSGERLFTHQVFTTESRVADESYARELRRKQEIRETLRAASYAGSTFGALILSSLAFWKIGEMTATDVIHGQPEKVWIYPLALVGATKGGQQLMNMALRLRPKD
jgi:hypothetical protein